MSVMLPGPIKVDCPCGCGAFGTPRKKAWGDGLRHVRGCPGPEGSCRRCVGSRQRGKAYRRENRVAKDIGGAREHESGRWSGADVRAGLWSIEETGQESLVRGLRRWWTSKQMQTKVARLLARDGEAHAFVASWDGRPQLVVVPYEDWVGQFPYQVTE